VRATSGTVGPAVPAPAPVWALAVPFVLFAAGIATGASWATWH
jgi:hypothetical protein